MHYSPRNFEGSVHPIEPLLLDTLGAGGVYPVFSKGVHGREGGRDESRRSRIH